MSIHATRDIIVIGGSSGSGAVIKTLMNDLPADLPAAVFISTHVPANSLGFLPEVLRSHSKLPVTQATDGEAIKRGHVYLAAPDRHLLLMGDRMQLGTGPRENMVRPSIDALFRSAALSFGPRVLGVVLTGMLNDGAAGLHAIKACGGTAIVQHPIDAEADQMPLAAMEAVNVDYLASAADLGELISRLAGTQAGLEQHTPRDLRLEVEIAAGQRVGSAELATIAKPTPVTCPECHGVLSEVVDSRPLRFRCQVGHGYTADVLATHMGNIDEAIRVAMRMMEERVILVERMASDARDTGRDAIADLYEARGIEYRRHATTLRDAAIASMGT